MAGLFGVRCILFSGTSYPIPWTPGLPNSAYFAHSTTTIGKLGIPSALPEINQ